MRCEYCDSVIKTVPGNGICPNCGSVLSDNAVQPFFVKRPFSKAVIPQGYFEFTESAVSFSVKHPRIPRINVLIPYDELFDVSYIPATKWLKGFLCVRDWKSRTKPLPRKFGEHRLGDTIIYFELAYNAVFYSAYEFLKQCAEFNARCKENNNLHNTHQ